MADSVYKVVELVGTSDASWEETVQKCCGITVEIEYGERDCSMKVDARHER